MARRKSKKKSRTQSPKQSQSHNQTVVAEANPAQATMTSLQGTTMNDYNTSTATNDAPERSRTKVRPVDLAAAVTKGLNEQHENLQLKANSLLVKEILEQIRQQLESTEDGVVSIVGLGTFNCRMVTRDAEEGGEPETVKRVNFRVAKAPA